jgi:hypothetical protein
MGESISEINWQGKVYSMADKASSKGAEPSQLLHMKKEISLE